MIVKICFIAHCSFSIVFSQVNNVGGGQAPGQIVEEGGEEEFYQPDQSQIGVGSPVAGQASGGSMVAQAPPRSVSQMCSTTDHYLLYIFHASKYSYRKISIKGFISKVTL